MCYVYCDKNTHLKKKKKSIVPVITIRQIFFDGGVYRVFVIGSNKCRFDSSVKNTNVPQFFFRLSYSYDRHNNIALSFMIKQINDYLV